MEQKEIEPIADDFAAMMQAPDYLADVTDGLNVCQVPEGLRAGLLHFLTSGRPTGSFLRAVIDNDLREACQRADLVNRYRIFDVVNFLHNYAPLGVWGHEGAHDDYTRQWAARMKKERSTIDARARKAAGMPEPPIDPRD